MSKLTSTAFCENDEVVELLDGKQAQNANKHIDRKYHL